MTYSRSDSGGESRGRSSGGFGRRSGGRFGDRDAGRPSQKYDATCAKCGKRCQVPFKPSGSKPVLCSDCFRQSGDARGSPIRMASPGVSSEQMNMINAKLDKIIKILADLRMDEDESEDGEPKNSEADPKAE